MPKTIRTPEALREWVRSIPTPSWVVVDQGIGHWEMHGRTGYDSRPVQVLNDSTTGPFTCYLGTTKPEEHLTEIFRIIEEEGKDTTHDIKLDGTIELSILSLKPTKITLYWEEDY